MFKKLGATIKDKKQLRQFNAANVRINKKGVFVLFNPKGLRGANEISTVIRDIKTSKSEGVADYCLEYVIIDDEIKPFKDFEDFSKRNPILNKLQSFSIEDLLYSNDSFDVNLIEINGAVTAINEKYRLIRDHEYIEDKIKAMINIKESLINFGKDKKLQKDYITVVNGLITYG